jgi:glyoxylate reductase
VLEINQIVFQIMDSTSRPKILLLGRIDHAHEKWQTLSKYGDLIEPKSTNRSDFIKECQSGGLDGVIAAYRTFPSYSITGQFDAELCSVLPKSWLYLAHCGAGYDQIDVAACSERDPPLLVSNVPDPTNNATADTAMFLLLGALRQFNQPMTALRRNEWRGNPPAQLGHDPKGKVLGILGMGGIGRNIKRKAAAFGMTTIYHNRNKLSDELADGAEYVSFEDLLKRSDVLSLNLPLNKHTRHMISTPQFKLMKPSAVIINTARGAVIDESALVQALDDKLIAGAGLDVYEDEPKVHEGLVRNDKVMLLPHLGTWSVETQTEMEEWCMGNIESVLSKGVFVSGVPEQRGLWEGRGKK